VSIFYRSMPVGRSSSLTPAVSQFVATDTPTVPQAKIRWHPEPKHKKFQINGRGDRIFPATPTSRRPERTLQIQSRSDTSNCTLRIPSKSCREIKLLDRRFESSLRLVCHCRFLIPTNSKSDLRRTRQIVAQSSAFKCLIYNYKMCFRERFS
jgi:hypothetical protein